jgi:hypothetical protein
MGYERFSRAFEKCNSNFSDSLKIRYFSRTYDDVYDDEVNLTISGTDLWLSGTVQSLDTTQGSADANLIEQGRLINSDTKIFLNGSVLLTGSETEMKIQIGSPTGEQYSLIPMGALNRQVNGVPIFKVAYLRRLTTGSLIGEI